MKLLNSLFISELGENELWQGHVTVGIIMVPRAGDPPPPPPPPTLRQRFFSRLPREREEMRETDRKRVNE